MFVNPTGLVDHWYNAFAFGSNGASFRHVARRCGSTVGQLIGWLGVHPGPYTSNGCDIPRPTRTTPK